MIYGYARVSTGAQDLTSQLAQLKGAGCEKVFREKLTGTTADRPQLQKLITKLAPGDAVIIAAVDRLSRDTTDLLLIAREMQKAGAGIRSLAEPLLDTTSDFAEIVFAILGVAAKLERRRILDRTARGRADAKAKGVKFRRYLPHFLHGGRHPAGGRCASRCGHANGTPSSDRARLPATLRTIRDLLCLPLGTKPGTKPFVPSPIMAEFLAGCSAMRERTFTPGMEGVQIRLKVSPWEALFFPKLATAGLLPRPD
jgi:hypothetical protein